jgi:hypothetical protein
MRKPAEPTVRVRCPLCQAAVPLHGSVIDLGGRSALVCPECKELSLASLRPS